MSDDRELSPEQERVRRLLAEARVETPMPDDVVARLDRVLAQLADDQDAAPATVVELASRRRRKAATLLVAAAAVVAVGVGAGNLLPGSGLTQADSDSAGASAESGPPPAAAPSDREANGAGAAAEAQLDDLSAASLLRVREDHFADDVARLRERRVTAFDGESSSETAPFGDTDLTEGMRSVICDPAPYGPGSLVVVRFAGMPAVLAFRPPAGDTQVVDLLECGTAAILRSVTLPAP